MNLYDVLGVPHEATPEQVRTAYRALVQLFHPDRLRHVRPEVRSFAEERLKTLNQAYEVLGDPERRAAYDRQAGLSRPAPPRGSNGGAAAREAPRSTAYQRHLRRTQLDEQLVQVDRSVRDLKAERDRVHAGLREEHRRVLRRFWLIAALTGLGAGFLPQLAARLFALPPQVVTPAAQAAIFALGALAYELATALLIAAACRPSGGRLRVLSIAWAAAKAAPVALVVGLSGWAGWRLAFAGGASPAAALSLAAIFLASHLVFTWLAMGGQTSIAREKRRLFDQANDLILRTYEHELSVLRAQRAAVETE